jgi:sugar phosphate isomerase/epimerase
MPLSRRDALRSLAGSAVTCLAATAQGTQPGLQPQLSFAFSLYGMKSLPLGRALRVCADIGYSGVELACMTAWPGDPVSLNRVQRRELRQQLLDLALDLPALMDNLKLLVPDSATNLERLKLLAELAHDLPREDGSLPLFETVLGGSPLDWEKNRDAMVAALGEWARIAQQAELLIAVKAHAMNAAHRPEHLAWLLQQVNSPWIKCAFDFSHFERQGLLLSDALRPLLPETVFVHVKDNVMHAGKTEFALPGEGTTNYREYLRQLSTGGYRGAVCVEVSAQVSGKADYNPIIAAERSYLNLQRAFEAAGVRART